MSYQVHHIIPKNIMGLTGCNPHPFMAQLIDENLWNPESIEYNTISLPGLSSEANQTGVTRHNGSHPNYDIWLRDVLSDIEATSASDEIAVKKVLGLTNWLKARFVDPDFIPQLNLEYGKLEFWNKWELHEIEKTPEYKLSFELSKINLNTPSQSKIEHFETINNFDQSSPFATQSGIDKNKRSDLLSKTISDLEATKLSTIEEVKARDGSLSTVNSIKLGAAVEILRQAGTFGDAIDLVFFIDEYTQLVNQGKDEQAQDLLGSYVGGTVGGVAGATLAITAVGAFAAVIFPEPSSSLAGFIVLAKLVAGIGGGVGGSEIGKAIGKEIINKLQAAVSDGGAITFYDVVNIFAGYEIDDSEINNTGINNSFSAHFGGKTIIGGAGNDVFENHASSAVIYGGAGYDTIILKGASNDYIGSSLITGGTQLINKTSSEKIIFYDVEKIQYSSGTNPTPASPSIQVHDASAAEGDSLVFRVELSEDASSNVTFLATTFLHETQGRSDYIGFQNKSYTIDKNVGFIDISIPTVNRTDVEATEAMALKIHDVQGATINDAWGIGTIYDNDPSVILNFADTAEFGEKLYHNGTDYEKYYTFVTKGDGRLAVDLKGMFADANIEVLDYVFNPIGTAGYVSNNSGTADEHLEFDYTNNQRYYLKITSNDYTTFDLHLSLNADKPSPSSGKDLQITSTSVSSNQWKDGDSIDIDFVVENLGNEEARTSYSGVYLSENQNISTGDTLIYRKSAGIMSAGERNSEGGRITLDFSSLGIAPGKTYFLGTIADIDNDVAETNDSGNAETNNDDYADNSPIQITVTGSTSSALPDIAVQNVSLNSITFRAGDDLSVDYKIKNVGNANATNNNRAQIYLSTDRNLTSTDFNLGNEGFRALDVNEVDDENQTYALPSDLAPGTYYVYVVAGTVNGSEGNEENLSNNTSSPIEITISDGDARPDLVIENVRLDNNVVNEGTDVRVYYDVVETNNSDAGSTKTGIYISRAQNFSDAVFLEYDTVSNDPNERDAENENLGDISEYGPGQYYIFVVADYDNTLSESNDHNNVSAPIPLTIKSDTPSSSDLKISNLKFTGDLNYDWDEKFYYSFDVENLGADSANFKISNYFSTDTTFTSNEEIFSHDETGFKFRESMSFSNHMQVNGFSSGYYYVGVEIDSGDATGDSNSNNNIAYQRVYLNAPEIPKPDYLIKNVQFSNYSPTKGASFTANYVLENKGTATAPSTHVGFYVSTDAYFDPTQDTFVGYSYDAALAGGTESNENQTSAQFADFDPGEYYLFLKADYSNVVAEDNEDNNVSDGVKFTIQDNIREIREPTVQVTTHDAIEAGEVIFSFKLDYNPQNKNVIVKYRIEGGSATEGSDFENRPGQQTITLNSDTTTKTIRIKTLPDSNVENNESISLVIDSVEGGEASQSVYYANIIDDDAGRGLPKIYFKADSLSPKKEGDIVSFTLQGDVKQFNGDYLAEVSVAGLKMDQVEKVEVDYIRPNNEYGDAQLVTDIYQVVDGSWMNTRTGDKTEYIANSKPFVKILLMKDYIAGDWNKHIVRVYTKDDNLYTGNKEIFLDILPLTENTFLYDQSFLFLQKTTILENDTDNSGILAIKALIAEIQEKDMGDAPLPVTFEVTRTGGSQGNISFDWIIQTGSEEIVDAYNSRGGTITFDDGDSEPKSIVLYVPGDNNIESNDTIRVLISAVGNSEFINPIAREAAVTIIDNDIAHNINDFQRADSSFYKKIPTAFEATGYFQLNNQGKNKSVGDETYNLYLSSDDNLDSYDTLLFSQEIPSIAPGQNRRIDTQYSILSTLQSGVYYLLHTIKSENEENTSILHVESIEVMPSAKPDLYFTGGSLNPLWGAGETLSEWVEIYNNGDSGSLYGIDDSEIGKSESVTVEAFLSKDNTLDALDTFLGKLKTSAIEWSQKATYTLDFDLPSNTLPGEYNLIWKIDSKEHIDEKDETNNVHIFEGVQVSKDITPESFIGSSIADHIIRGIGNNTLKGSGGHDDLKTFSGINTLDGGTESDFLLGGFQADNLDGGAGNDVLRSDAGSFFGGSDTLAGGQGNDLLMGGKGADTFIFNTNEGNDTIAAFNIADMGYGPLSGYTGTPNGKDFQTGVDHIKLNGFSSVDASNILSSITDGANGAVFSAEGTEITFYGVDANQLTPDDFILV